MEILADPASFMPPYSFSTFPKILNFWKLVYSLGLRKCSTSGSLLIFLYINLVTTITNIKKYLSTYVQSEVMRVHTLLYYKSFETRIYITVIGFYLYA